MSNGNPKTELKGLLELIVNHLETAMDDKIDARLTDLMNKTQNSSDKEHYTLAEAAEYLGVSQATLYKWNKKCVITFTKPGGRIYYLKNDLDHYIRDNRKKVTSKDEIKSEVLTEIYTNSKLKNFS
jgi:excisionase family DNA binding protein